MAMSILKKIISNSFWLFIGNSISRLAMFFANIFAARLLSQEIFGQYVMIRNTISVIESLMSASIGNISIRKISENTHIKNNMIPEILVSIFFINAVISIIIVTILLIFSDFIANHFFLGSKEIVNGFYVGAFLLTVTLFSTALQKINIGLENFRVTAMIGMISTAISIPFIYILILNYKLLGALFGVSFFLLLDFLFKSFVIYGHLNLPIIPMYKNMKAIIRDMLFSSSLLAISGTITAFSFWYARVLIINKSNNFTDVAIFDVAYQWLTVIMVITGATTSIALQMLANSKNNNKNIFTTITMVNLSIAILFAITFSFFSKNAMSLSGENYIQYYYLIYIVSFMAILMTLSSSINKLLIVNGEQKYILINNFFSSCITLSFIELLSFQNIPLQLAIAFILYYVISLLLDIIRLSLFNKIYFLQN